MNNKLKTLWASTTLAVVFASPTSQALNLSSLAPDYAGLFLFSETIYEQIYFDESTLEETPLRDSKLSAIIGRAGYNLNRFVELEFRAGTGIETAVVPQNIGGTVYNDEFSIDYIVGGYLVGSLPITRKGRAYALIGYSRVDITTDIPPGDGAESDASFGLGGDVFIGKNFSFNMEYTSYLFQQSLELHALSLGVKIDF